MAREMDFHRVEPPPHLALGFGEHLCMGIHLAKIQLELTVATLARRFPDPRAGRRPRRDPLAQADLHAGGGVVAPGMVTPPGGVAGPSPRRGGPSLGAAGHTSMASVGSRSEHGPSSTG